MYKEIVKKAMARYEMNETEFAAMLNVDQSSVAKWLTGANKPNKQALILMQMTEHAIKRAKKQLNKQAS